MELNGTGPPGRQFTIVVRENAKKTETEKTIRFNITFLS